MGRFVAVASLVVALLVAVAIVLLAGGRTTTVPLVRTTTVVVVQDPAGARPRADGPRDAAVPSPPVTDAPTSADSVTATLRVRVVDGDGASPLAGATVILAEDDDETEPRSATTDASGCVRFDGLAVHSWVVRATAPGRVRSGWTWIEPKAGGTAECSIPLEGGAWLDAVVLDDATGRPLAGVLAVVQPGGALDGMASSSSDPPFGSATTGEDGRFRVLVDPGEMATATLSAAGHVRFARTVIVSAGGAPQAPLEFRMERGGRIGGTVTDPDGKPVAGARVFAIPGGDEMLLRSPESTVSSTGNGGRSVSAEKATSGADGRYEMDGIAFGGSYVLFARAVGFAASATAGEVTVAPNTPSATVDLALRKPGALAIRVLDPDGQPVAAAAVTVISDFTWPKLVATDADGSLRVEGCEIARYGLDVVAAGFPFAHADADVAAGADTSLTIRLERGVSLSGTVVDDRGEPVAAATVNVHRPYTAEGRDLPRSEGSAKSGAGGAFRVDGLRPGLHVIGGYAAGHAGPSEATVGVPAESVVVRMPRRAKVHVKLTVPPGAAAPAAVHLFAGHLADFSKPGNELWGGSTDSRDFGDGSHDVWFDPGKSLLRVIAAGFVRIERRFDLDPGDETDLGTVALDPGLEFAGIVEDAGAKPVAGARVSFGESFTPEQQTATTAADGSFRLSHVGAGRIAFKVEADGFLVLQASADAAPGGTPSRVRLSRGALLAIAVVDAEGRPVPGVDLTIRRAADAADAEALECVSADHRGIANVRVPAGKYRVTAEGRGTSAECEGADGTDVAVRVVVR